MDEIGKAATISEDGLYRYGLLRRWTDGNPLAYVMLNPSTADATLDDQTIRRCMFYARRDGYGGIYVLNLYAYRTADPKTMFRQPDPVGPKNDEFLYRHLWAARIQARPVVAAWGMNAPAERVEQVMALVPGVDWRCLGVTKDGHPRHPSRLGNDLPLSPFPPQESTDG